MNLTTIIVSYNPTAALLKNVRELIEAHSKILIIDNASTRGREFLAEATQMSGVKVLQNSANLGIAAALNRGVTHAMAEGTQWFITLDQDTFLSQQAIQEMFKAYEGSREKENIGMLAPLHYDNTTGHISRELLPLADRATEREIVMTSGNLIPLRTFEKVKRKNGQYYREDFFIEYVDHEFCLLLHRHGLKIILVGPARMGQSLGDIQIHQKFGRQFFSHNYAAVRRYYRGRNRVILYFSYPGFWILQDQRFAIIDMLKILLVEKHAWQKVKATLLGTLDGLLRRMGPARWKFSA